MQSNSDPLPGTSGKTDEPPFGFHIDNTYQNYFDQQTALSLFFVMTSHVVDRTAAQDPLIWI